MNQLRRSEGFFLAALTAVVTLLFGRLLRIKRLREAEAFPEPFIIPLYAQTKLRFGIPSA